MSATIIPFPGTQAKEAAYAAYVARFEQRLAESPWMRETLARAQAAVVKLPQREAKPDDAIERGLELIAPENRERARQLLREMAEAMRKLPKRED